MTAAHVLLQLDFLELVRLPIVEVRRLCDALDREWQDHPNKPRDFQLYIRARTRLASQFSYYGFRLYRDNLN